MPMSRLGLAITSNCSKLPLITIQAVKELKAENDVLKARVAGLEQDREWHTSGAADLQTQALEIAMLKQQLAELRAAFTAARLDAAGVAPARVPQDR